MKNDTKWKGDLAEQTVILEAMKRNINVSIPFGDRLPYDLILDKKGKLIRVQVKAAWFDKTSKNYKVDARTAKTNRKHYRYTKYKDDDFDIAIIVILKKQVFYIMPAEIFNSYGSGITLAESEKRQRLPKSIKYRNAWYLLEK